MSDYTPDDIERILRSTGDAGRLIKARLEGAEPGILLHNGLAMERLAEAKAIAEKKGSRGKYIPSREDEAEWGTYRLADGSLYLPTKNLARCLIVAGKAFPRPKGQGTLEKIVAGAITIPLSVGSGYVFRDPKTGKPCSNYRTDVQPARVSKSAVMRARPHIESWAAEVEILLDTQAIGVQVFAQIMVYAGTRVGLGDYRPTSGGPYGRFRVAKFEVIEED